LIPQGKSFTTAIKKSVKAAKLARQGIKGQKNALRAMKAKRLRTQARALYKQALREQMGELWAAAKIKLGYYMVTKSGESVPPNIKDEITRDGVELFLAKFHKKTVADMDVAEVVDEVISNTDPTGIYDVVSTFDGGQRCEKIRYDVFPTENLWTEPEFPVEYDEITSDLRCCSSGSADHVSTETNVETSYRCELSCKKKQDCLFFSHSPSEKKCSLCKYCDNTEVDGWNSWRTPKRIRTCSGHNFYDWFWADDGSKHTLGDTVSFPGSYPNSWWQRDPNYRHKYCRINSPAPRSNYRYIVCARHECYRDQQFTCSGVFAELQDSCAALTERSKYGVALKEYTGGECQNNGNYAAVSYNAFSCVWHHSKLQCAQAKCCSCITRAAVSKRRSDEWRRAMADAGIDLPIRFGGFR
jgi:hypothetical protein